MSWRFELETEAEKEFWNIYDYYSKIDIELGHRFAHEFDNSVNLIINFPNAGTTIQKKFKRKLIPRFQTISSMK